MPRSQIRLVCVAAFVAAWGGTPATAAPIGVTHGAYSRAVTQICAHALLFERQHAIGTRAGALSVALDIRSSTRRRLVRVGSLLTPADERRTVRRWLVLERRLADAYAADYVGIFDLIDAPVTPARSRLVARLLHAPDPIRLAAARLEQRLQVPGCTGG
jgi:hypothetical protein